MHRVDWHAQWVNLFHPSSLDHPQPFEIEPSSVVAGDDITLTCRGTRYLYDRLKWYDPLGHMVPKGKTTFQIEPYAISLSIKLPNVSRNHTLGYECQALNMNSNKVVNTTSVLTIDGEFHLPSTKEIFISLCTLQKYFTIKILHLSIKWMYYILHIY